MSLYDHFYTCFNYSPILLLGIIYILLCSRYCQNCIAKIVQRKKYCTHLRVYDHIGYISL